MLQTMYGKARGPMPVSDGGIGIDPAVRRPAAPTLTNNRAKSISPVGRLAGVRACEDIAT